MTMPLSSLVNRLGQRIRPNSAAFELADLKIVAGWYVRKGLAPFLRGLIRRISFGAVHGFVFVGPRVSILYPSRIKLGRWVSIGGNSAVNAYSKEGIVIGDNVTIRENAWIQCSSSPTNPGVGLTIGHGTYIGPGVILGVGGPIVIGAGCQIGSSVVLISENHSISDGNEVSGISVLRKGISIGDGCWIGHRVAIVDGVVLGRDCVVGAGAVVTKSFGDGVHLVGVPARPTVSGQK